MSLVKHLKQSQKKNDALLKSAVKKALKQCKGNIRETAKKIGMPNGTLYALIKRGRLSDLKSLASKKRGRPKLSAA